MFACTSLQSVTDSTHSKVRTLRSLSTHILLTERYPLLALVSHSSVLAHARMVVCEPRHSWYERVGKHTNIQTAVNLTVRKCYFIIIGNNAQATTKNTHIQLSGHSERLQNNVLSNIFCRQLAILKLFV